jgi:RNA recognition motif-containing protein
VSDHVFRRVAGLPVCFLATNKNNKRTGKEERRKRKKEKTHPIETKKKKERMAEKNDVFVGNITFNTTEEQLKDLFSFIGQ